MSSIFALIFLALQQRIGGITDNKGKVIRFIDHDIGFLDEDIPPLSYPAVLIDTSAVEFTNVSEGVQTGKGVVKLRLVVSPYSASNNITPVDFKEKGLRYYEIEQLLHLAIQGWSPSYVVDEEEQIDPDIFGAFNRVAYRTDNRRRDVRIRELSYMIAFEDYSTRRQITYVPVEPDLCLNLDVPTGEVEL